MVAEVSLGIQLVFTAVAPVTQTLTRVSTRVKRVFRRCAGLRLLGGAVLLAVLAALVMAGTSQGGVPRLTQVGAVEVTAAPTASAPVVQVGVKNTESSIGTWARGRAVTGIPVRALLAYGAAELLLRQRDPSCHLSWTTLAGIGSVESAHGQLRGAKLGEDGVSTPRIRGPLLLGAGGDAHVSDTDGGAMDGVAGVDRAVGPMQFIPSTWARWSTDGNADGVSDPDSIDDAAAAAGRYLCAAGGDLATAQGWRKAIFAYNHSDDYVTSVFRAATEAGR